MKREETKVIQIGTRKIGGGNPIAIQSMTNTKTEDVEATVAQILALEKAGCQIIRAAVPDMPAVKLIEKLKETRSTSRAKYPKTIDTKGKQSLYDNLGGDETLTLLVHNTIKSNARDGFRDMDGSGIRKMRALRKAVEEVLINMTPDKIDDIMQLIIAQKEY